MNWLEILGFSVLAGIPLIPLFIYYYSQLEKKYIIVEEVFVGDNIGIKLKEKHITINKNNLKIDHGNEFREIIFTKDIKLFYYENISKEMLYERHILICRKYYIEESLEFNTPVIVTLPFSNKYLRYIKGQQSIDSDSRKNDIFHVYTTNTIYRKVAAIRRRQIVYIVIHDLVM